MHLQVDSWKVRMIRTSRIFLDSDPKAGKREEIWNCKESGLGKLKLKQTGLILLLLRGQNYYEVKLVFHF